MKKSIPFAAALVAAGVSVPAAAEASATCAYDAALKRVDVAITGPITGVQADGSGHIRGIDPGSGTTAGTTADTTTGTTGVTTGATMAKPRLAVTVLRPTTRSQRRGVRLRLVASANVSATVRLRVSRRTAHRLGLRRVLVGRANVGLEAGRRRVIVVAVRRKALRAPLTMRAGASDTAGRHATPVTRRIAARIG